MTKKMMIVAVVLFAMFVFVMVAGCHHTFVDLGACVENADCADGDPCTVDVCGIEGTCIQIPSDNPACDPCTPTDEVCDGVDNDCDEVIDEDTYCAACSGGPIMPYYRDADYDGYGDPSVSELMCSGLGAIGWIDIVGDCDDTDPEIHPGASETCPYDEMDNDCDGETDEDVVTETRYRDEDGDGYGDPEFSGIVCHDAPPSSGVLVAGDCADGNRFVHPGATELCDGIDNDCDGETDESDPHAGEFCWGMLSCGEPDCIVPVHGWLECTETYYGWSLECHLNCVTDETCDDGADNDCDTIVDDGCEPPTECTTDLDCARFDGECLVFRCLANSCFAFERDDDGDGRSLCGGLPEGERYDCDDHDPAVHPGADELCDNLDNDCDGNFDDGLFVAYYLDFDHDGWGSPDWLVQFACPDAGDAGGVPNRGDCDDSDPEIHPGAGCPECDMIYFRDADSDVYGDPTNARLFSCDDESPPGYVPTIGDCDDSNRTVHILADEVCGNGRDDNCDGRTDEDCP